MKQTTILIIACVAIVLGNLFFVSRLMHSIYYNVNIPYNFYLLGLTGRLDLVQGKTILQKFHVKGYNLNQIGFRFSKDKDMNCTYDVALYKENSLVFERRIRDRDIQNYSMFRRPSYDSFMMMQFSPIVDSREHLFEYVINTVGACADGTASLVYSPITLNNDFELYENGVRKTGELMMKFGFQ